jgi:hypothetical protein
LGHTNIYVTATVYPHALTNDEATAASKWESAMHKTANSKVVEIRKKPA